MAGYACRQICRNSKGLARIMRDEGREIGRLGIRSYPGIARSAAVLVVRVAVLAIPGLGSSFGDSYSYVWRLRPPHVTHATVGLVLQATTSNR